MRSYSLIETSRGGLGPVSPVGDEVSSRRCTARRLSDVEGGLGTSSCRSMRHGVPGLDGGGNAQVSEVTDMHASLVINVSEADPQSQNDEFELGVSSSGPPRRSRRVHRGMGADCRRRGMRAKRRRCPNLGKGCNLTGYSSESRSMDGRDDATASQPVSYTHLTLPTILLV